MEYLAPRSIIQKLDVNAATVFRDSTLLLCSSAESEKTTRNIVFELLLNAANRAAFADRSVSYFRPCELVCLNQLHVHGTPAFDFTAWDSIRFFYPTEESLVCFFSRFHQTKRFPDLIVIEQLDRIIGQERQDFLTRLHSLTCLFADTLEHIHEQTKSQNRTLGCRLLVSCTLPQTLFEGQFGIAKSLVWHGLRQACLCSKEGDDAHFSMADITGAFEFKLLLQETEIFFESFLHNPDLLCLVQQRSN